MKTIYRTSDGTEFDSASDARKHEAEQYAEVLGSATAEDYVAAAKGENKDVAEAVKRAYQAINQGRLDRGEVKARGPRKTAADSSPVTNIADASSKRRSKATAAA